MVYCIQHGLRALTEAFYRPPATKRRKGQILTHDGPKPRVEMSYTYLMAWFELHYPAIIQPGEEPPEGVRFTHLRRFEGSQWLRTYIIGVQKLVRRYDAYILYSCFPSILGVGYGEEFFNAGDERSSLGQGEHLAISFGVSMWRHLLPGAVHAEPFCSPVWVRPTLCWESQHSPGLQSDR